VQDATELENVPRGLPGQDWADSIFGGCKAKRPSLRAVAIPCTVDIEAYRIPAAPALLRAHDAAVHRGRCRIGKVFGIRKRTCAPCWMRWLGLARAGLQVRLAAIAVTCAMASALLQPLFERLLHHIGDSAEADQALELEHAAFPRVHAACSGLPGSRAPAFWAIPPQRIAL